MSFVDNEINVSSMSMDKYMAEYTNQLRILTFSGLKRLLFLGLKFSKVKESSFNDKISIKWFSDGVLNASFKW